VNELANESRNHLEIFLAVPGAKTTLLVSAAKEGFSSFHDHRGYFGEDPESNSFQFDDVSADTAMFKHGNVGQGFYVDPGRDVIGVYFSTNGYIPHYGEHKMSGFIRQANKMLAGDLTG
jgi:hypothetical protein